MAHNTVYGYCENKCKVEVPTKAQFDTHVENAATKAELNAKHKDFSVTIATGWSGSAAPYTKEVTISGILASDKPIIDLVASSTYSTAEKQIEAWGYVYRAVTAANTITFYATDKPEVAIPIQVKVMR